MRSFLLGMFLLGALWLPPGRAEERLLDVLVLAVDDLRPWLGCYGKEGMQTPHLDALAERSLLFERAYCQYAKCGTSRLSLMTGLRPDSIGVFSNNVRDVTRFRKRRPNLPTLSSWFMQEGYEAYSFGKIDHDGWAVAKDWTIPPSPGRDREMWEIVDETHPNGETIIAERLACPVLQRPDVEDEGLYAGRLTTQVLQHWEDRSGGTPRFYAVGYRRPHLPFIAPERDFALYEGLGEDWLAPHPVPA
ncbi:MAG: sulfatase-like hydrolase/transferase, partial [Verrucomicrobiota bacterium]